MAGAALFAAALVAVLVAGTYVLQGAILAVQVAAWLGWRAAVAVGAVLALIVCAVWWVFDRDGATAALRAATPAPSRP